MTSLQTPFWNIPKRFVKCLSVVMTLLGFWYGNISNPEWPMATHECCQFIHELLSDGIFFSRTHILFEETSLANSKASMIDTSGCRFLNPFSVSLICFCGRWEKNSSYSNYSENRIKLNHTMVSYTIHRRTSCSLNEKTIRIMKRHWNESNFQTKSKLFERDLSELGFLRGKNATNEAIKSDALPLN